MLTSIVVSLGQCLIFAGTRQCVLCNLFHSFQITRRKQNELKHAAKRLKNNFGEESLESCPNATKLLNDH